jgi:hypothetical protein
VFQRPPKDGSRVALRGRRSSSRGRDGSTSLRRRHTLQSSAHREIVAVFVWVLTGRGEQAGAEVASTPREES